MNRRYWFIRHAQAQTGGPAHDFALFRQDMMARLDPPLTAAGICQARQLGRVLARRGVEAIVPSAMARARQTACWAAQTSGIALYPSLEALGEVAVGTAFDRFFPWIARLPEARLAPALKQAIGDGVYNMASLWCLLGWLRGKTRAGEPLARAQQRIRAVLAHLDRLPLSSIAVIGHAFWLFGLARMLAPPLGRRLRWFGHVSVTCVAADGHGRYRLVELAQSLPQPQPGRAKTKAFGLAHSQ